MTDPVEDFLAAIDVRLDAGASDYGNQSFVRPIAETMRQILEEALDEVGWCYVLWCQAARKTNFVRDQKSLRTIWRQNLEHRIRRNDRRREYDPHAYSAESCMKDIEVLALDLFDHHQQLQRRLQPIARAIEVAQYSYRNPHQGRYGGTRDPRSDD